MPALDFKQAASTLIDQGASTDEIKLIFGRMKREASQLIDQGKSVAEIEALQRQAKWKNTQLFQPVAPPKPEKFEGQGFTRNLQEEFGTGVRNVFNPSEASFPGSEWLRNKGAIGEFGADIVGAGLGASQAAFAIPSAIVKTYASDPLREAGHEKWALAADVAGGLALPFGGGPLRALGATSKYGKTALKVAGAALDPLSAVGALGKGGKLKTATRTADIVTAKANIAHETNRLKEAEDLLLGYKQNRGSLQRETEALIAPQVPVMPQRFAETLIKPADEVAAGAEDAAKLFKATKVTATEDLFAQSKVKYDEIRAKYGHVTVPEDEAQKVAEAVSSLGDDLRTTTASKAVSGKLAETSAPLIAGGRPIEGLGAYAQEFIKKAMGQGQMVDIADFLAMRNRLSAQNRISHDVNVINANKGVIKIIDQSLEKFPGTIGQELGEAGKFHRYVHETVGPSSITQRIFKQNPENVVKNIFLPEGKTTPNITTIRKAKDIFMRENPEGWSAITQQALYEFGNRIKDGRTGVLDVQKFNREFNKFENAFREALGTGQFEAMRDFRNMIRQVNQDSSVFRAAQRRLTDITKGVSRDISEQSHVVQHQGRVLRSSQTELKNLTGQRPGLAQVFMSPYTTLAIAQVFQAVQAGITQGIASPAVMRQLMQGVIWYTVGNPDFLTKLIGSPKMSKALSVIASGESRGPKIQNAARIMYEGMQENKGEQK